MKRIIIIMLLCLGFIYLGNKKEDIVIPKESIRFRIIANSNSSYDQSIKMKIKLELEKELSKLFNEKMTFSSFDKIISSNINLLKNKVKQVMQEEKILESFNIVYSNNYFPEKVYNGIKYKAGNYNSLVVTLGNGLGDNWWCILFPPLCLLENNNYTEIEYKMYVWEIIDKYS